MLFTSRRVALINLCLAGMEAAWIAPLWLLLTRVAVSPWLAYAVTLAALLAWMLSLELLSRTELEFPGYDLLALGLMALTSLLIVLAAYLARGPVLGAITVGERLWRGLALAAANLVLWQRATSATSRELTFFGVGRSFRVGFLLLIATAGGYAAATRAERDTAHLALLHPGPDRGGGRAHQREGRGQPERRVTRCRPGGSANCWRPWG